MKSLVRLIAATAATALAVAPSAGAQTVNFTGSTLRCFYTTVVCTPSTTSTLGGGNLTFQSGMFNVTTSNGFVGIGNTGNMNNFGTLSLAANVTPQTVAPGTNFLLHVLFTTPTGLAPNPVAFTGAVTGSVGTNTGGYFVNFDNTPRNITWTGGTGSLWVNDASINNTSVATATDLSGNILATATAVPEPASLMLVASGLAGLVGMAGRRRRQV